MTQCINCGNENFQEFFVEHIPCAHCDEITEVEYKVCTECGMVGKFVADEMIAGAVFTDDDTNQLFNSDMDELVRMFEQAAAEVDASEGVFSQVSMKDMVHRCLRCETRSFEKEKGLWHCPECGFEWEVIPGV